MKLADVRFLEVHHVEAGHAEGLDIGGGSPGIRDPGLLESAVMAPRSGYYETLAELAAVYKRAGLHAALVFLEVNGYPLTLDRKAWRVIVEGIASGEVSREEVAARFAEQMGDTVPLDDTR